jgi:hypothetical protein
VRSPVRSPPASALRRSTFEIWNEPDGSWTFLGTVQQYGALLAAAVSRI